MSFGIFEVISLLLGLSGFGVQPNPKAPTANVSLQYAMAEPDVVVHFDAISVIPGNYKVLQKLPEQAAIKASPELVKAVRKMVNEVEGARGLAKGATGIDVTTDIYDATVFFQFVPQQDPQFVAVVHGKFSAGTIDKIAKMSRGTVSKVGSATVVENGSEPSIGVTKDGVMIAGTPKLVRDRLADAWKAPARTPGSSLAYVAEVIDAKPIYAVALTMSQKARADVIAKMGSKNFVSDIVQRHKVAALSIYADGVGWTWVDSNKAGLDSMAMMSEGVLELMRAAHIAPRGFAKLALGAIDSYRGRDKGVDEVIRRKADLWKIVESYTGDGNFKTKIDKDPAKLRLSVRATGKSLSEVLPAGVFIPAMLFTVIGRSSPDHMEVGGPKSIRPAPTPVPARPASPGLGAPKKK